MQLSEINREKWIQRATTAVGMAKGAASICHLACGWPTIKPFIEPGTNYYPYDPRPRSLAIRTIDLERAITQIEPCDFYFLLGVFEDIEDVEMLFENIRNFPGRIVLSFSAWKPNVTIAHCDRHSSKLTSAEFTGYISKINRRIEAARHLTSNEVLLRLA